MPLANLAAALFQRTNLEHVRVVPAFAQCGVRENETHRGLFRITIQKQFLVLHDQVIGVNIVGGAFLFVGELAVGHLAFFINREVTGMGIMGGNNLQITNVIIVTGSQLHRAYDVVVLFLKHIGVDAVERMPVLVILFVFFNPVDEEQRQNFDALMEKLTLPLQVRQNRFADLNASELVFADLTDHISGKDFDTVQELYGVVASVDRLDHKAFLILVELARLAGVVIEVVANTDRGGFLAKSLCSNVVKLNGSSRVLLLRDVDAFQIDESLGCRAAGLCDALDGNFLDQPLVVRFHCIKAVHHVIDAVRLVSRGVAERQQRTKQL